MLKQLAIGTVTKLSGREFHIFYNAMNKQMAVDTSGDSL